MNYCILQNITNNKITIKIKNCDIHSINNVTNSDYLNNGYNIFFLRLLNEIYSENVVSNTELLKILNPCYYLKTLCNNGEETDIFYYNLIEISNLFYLFNNHSYQINKIKNKCDLSYINKDDNLMLKKYNYSNNKYIYNSISNNTPVNIGYYNINYTTINKFIEYSNIKNVSLYDLTLDNYNTNYLTYLYPIKYDYIIINIDEKVISQSKFPLILLHLLDIIITKSKMSNIIIKFSNIMLDIVIEFIYILNSLFTSKIILIKPTICDINSNERILLFKNNDTNNYKQHFINISNDIKHLLFKYRYTGLYLKNQLEMVYNSQYNKENDYLKPIITSIIDIQIPLFFLNKIKEYNTLLGNSQLEMLNTILIFFKSNNNTDKIKNIKKNIMSKCIKICDKFNILYEKKNNDIKLNIFL